MTRMLGALHVAAMIGLLEESGSDVVTERGQAGTSLSGCGLPLTPGAVELLARGGGSRNPPLRDGTDAERLAKAEAKRARREAKRARDMAGRDE